MNITDQDHDEIIAIQFGNDIYLAQTAINKAIELQDFTCIYSRAMFKLMSIMDLDPRWGMYADAPTIFTMTEYREFSEGHSYCNRL